MLGVTDRFESGFERVGHRRGAAEKDHGVGTGRRQLRAENGLGNAARALRPACRRLLQYMITMEARVFAHILVPLISENDVGLGLVGTDQKQLDREALGENPRMIAIIRVMPVPPATNPTLFGMPSTQWSPGFGPLISTVSPGSRS